MKALKTVGMLTAVVLILAACSSGEDTTAPETHEHTFESYVVNPTCTEKGYTRYTCTCGHNAVKPNDTETNALGHDFGENLEICTRCGVANPNYVAPHEHAEETVTVPSTCTVKGKTTVRCKICGKVISETELDLDLTEHDYAETKAADCLNGNVETCSRCGDTKTTVNALGCCKDNGTITVKPTCYKDGKVVYKCIRCDSIISTETVVKLQHSYQDDRCIYCGATDPSSIPNIEDYSMGQDGLLVFIDDDWLELTTFIVAEDDDTLRAYLLYNKWNVLYNTETEKIIAILLN